MRSKDYIEIDRRARGVYCLLIELKKARKIKVGSLGEFRFPAGYYVYVGSALNGLRARILRHFRRKKKLRWHIDYLLRESRAVDALAVKTNERLECELRERVASICGAKSAVRGFGSSDCSCESHLLHFARNPRRELKRQVQNCLA